MVDTVVIDVVRGGIEIVIPMYNEENRIGDTLKEIREFISDNKGFVRRIILVDDASTDRTVEWCRVFSKGMPVIILQRMKNGGKWAAIRDGLRCVEGRVLIMDADGSASIWNLEVCDLRNDVIIGNRFDRGSDVSGKGVLRTIVSNVYRAYFKVLYSFAGGVGRLVVKDPQCPFKVFFVRTLDVSRMTVDRFAGDIELMLLLSERNRSIQNVPISFRHVRGSRVRPASVWEMAVDTWRVAYRYRSIGKKMLHRKVYEGPRKNKSGGGAQGDER